MQAAPCFRRSFEHTQAGATIASCPVPRDRAGVFKERLNFVLFEPAHHAGKWLSPWAKALPGQELMNALRRRPSFRHRADEVLDGLDCTSCRKDIGHIC